MKATDPIHFSLDRPLPVLADRALESLRVRTWFFHVANRAIGREVAALKRVMWEQVVLESDQATPKLGVALKKWLDSAAQSNRLSVAQLNMATNLRYVDYQNGKTSPSDSNLAVLERLLPGSRAEYDFGPQGEPLWGVLAGKITICEAYVEEQLPPDTGTIEIDFKERVQRVFNALISPVRRIKLEDVPDLGRVQQSAHPVWLSHIETIMPDPYADEDTPEILEVSAVDDQIVLAIALWQIALHRKEGPILRLEWLLVGLCNGVIAYHFTEEVQAFVLNLLRKQGTALDVDAKKKGAAILEYEKRWVTEIEVGSKVAELRRQELQIK